MTRKRTIRRPVRQTLAVATGHPWWIWLVLVAPPLILIAAVWDGTLPLGVPGEWTLGRVDFWPLVPWAMLPPLVVAAGYLVLVLVGARRLPIAEGREVHGWLSGLVLAGLVWVLTIQAFAPPTCGLEKSVTALYHWWTSGYFSQAKLAERDLRAFLGEYEHGISTPKAGTRSSAWSLSETERVGHIGTHPPGLIVGYALLIHLFEHSPWLTEAVVASQPEAVRVYADALAEHPDGGAGPLLQSDRAVLWAASLITHFLAIVLVVPLYFLLRRTCPPEASWRAVAFWPTVPSLAVFLPGSDALLPFFGITFLLFWFEGWARDSAARSFVSGIVFWTGMFVSLAMLPAAVLAVAITAWEGWICQPGQRPAAPGAKLLRAVAWAALAVLLPTILLWAWSGIRLPAVWFWNLANDAAFYEAVPRTYWKWLLVNPIEFAVAAGLPLTMFALAAYQRLVRNWRDRAAGPLWCCALVWGSLWLSGKNSGEVARLWIVLMPWLVWLAGETFALYEEESVEAVRRRNAIWWVGMALQLLLGLVFVFAVAGYPPPPMP